MTDVEPAPPVEEAPAPSSTPPRRSTALVVVSVLALVLLVSTVLLAVVAVDLKGDKDELTSDREAVAAAAGGFVDTLLAYDYRDPEGYRERVLARTAPPFSEQFESAVAELEADFEVAQQVSTGSIRDVFVADVDGGEGTATAIVVYDRVLDGAAGPRNEENFYVRLGLLERDGEWRVNDVVNLNLAFAAANPPDGSTTTTAG
jgi:hypothetical protein